MVEFNKSTSFSPLVIAWSQTLSFFLVKPSKFNFHLETLHHWIKMEVAWDSGQFDQREGIKEKRNQTSFLFY